MGWPASLLALWEPLRGACCLGMVTRSWPPLVRGSCQPCAQEWYWAQYLCDATCVVGELGFSLVRRPPELIRVPAPNTVNHVFFLFSALRSAYLAYGRHSDQEDQRAVETYLSGVQSATELEYRERQWLRAHS